MRIYKHQPCLNQVMDPERKRMMKKKLAIILLVIIIAGMAVNSLYWASQKSGYHCDEIYSHGLSNTTFHYRVYENESDIRWNQPSDITEYMVVPEDGRFRYGNVLYNQSIDVHPPLFYLIMHTAASFFPGSDSIYLMIVPNLLFMIGSCIFLYLIAKQILKKRHLALLTVFCYAFSVNCVNMVTYMRMYAQLMFFALGIVYWHIRFFENDFTLNRKIGIFMALFVFLGAHTQYYFILFMLPMFTMTCIFALPDRKKIKKYMLLMMGTGMVYYISWPYVLKHLFGTELGERSFNNFVGSSLIRSLQDYADLFMTAIGVVLVVAFVISLLIFVFDNLRRRNWNVNAIDRHQTLCLIATVSLFYFLLIVKIAPLVTDRYLAPIFPLLYVGIVYLMHAVGSIICRNLKHKERIVSAFMLILILLGTCLNAGVALYDKEADLKGYNYLFRPSEEQTTFFEETQGKKCVMVNRHEWQFLRNIVDYCNFSETAFVYEWEVEKLKDDAHIIGETDFVLYLYDQIDGDAMAQKLTEMLGFNRYEKVISANNRNWANIYRVYK